MEKEIIGMSLNEESTFLYLPEESMLIECGAGVALLLSRKVTREISTIFLSSPDPQYTAGLENLLYRSYQDITIYYPKAKEADFAKLKAIDSVIVPNWIPVEAGDVYSVGKQKFFEVIRTTHYGRDYIGFKLLTTVSKLKPEFDNYTTTEIITMKKAGKEVTYIMDRILMVYSIGLSGEKDLKDAPLWITGDQIMVHPRIQLAKKAGVKKVLFIKLDRDTWMANFDTVYRDVSSGEEYYSPIPAVPIINQFTWKI